MRPSERIREIQKQKRKNHVNNQYTEYPLELAIMQYLDEEREKEKEKKNYITYKESPDDYQS